MAKCFRTTCAVQVATCKHSQTGEMYCPRCAHRINEHNPGLVLFPLRRDAEGIDLMNLMEWVHGVKFNVFTPEDGGAHWATSTHYQTGLSAFGVERPAWATHVAWFSK
jgi:hypothetical protein